MTFKTWIATTLFVLCSPCLVYAGLIKYQLLGQVETHIGPNNFMSVGSEISGWVILDTNFFTPGGRFSMPGDGYGGMIDFYFDPAFSGVQIGESTFNKDQFYPGGGGVWGPTLNALPNNFKFTILDDGTFSFDQTSFNISVYCTFPAETNWQGTMEIKKAVPEPSTWLLFYTGLAAIVGLNLRQNKRK